MRTGGPSPCPHEDRRIVPVVSEMEEVTNEKDIYSYTG